MKTEHMLTYVVINKNLKNFLNYKNKQILSFDWCLLQTLNVQVKKIGYSILISLRCVGSRSLSRRLT